MRSRSMMNSLGSIALVVLGFCLGKIHVAQESHAQQAEATFDGNTVVVSGYTNSSHNPRYYVVHSDGSATVVKSDGAELLAPAADKNAVTKVELEHSFSRTQNGLDVRHSGRIGK